MKLFARYNRINLTVMVLLFLLSGISYYFLINYILVHELDEALEDYKSRIENFVEKQGKLPPAGHLDETLVSYEPTNELKQHTHLQTLNLKDAPTSRSHNYRQLVYHQEVKNLHYRVTIAKPIEGVKLLTRTVVLVTIAMLLIVITSTIILNLVILRRLWQPFYASLAVMKTFKIGRKQIPQFPSSSIEEFNYMNKLLEDTISNAESDFQILKEFTENASHEIQTPLAIIRSKLDLVIQEEGLSEKQTHALSSIYSGIKRLTKLNQSLLLLAKIENNQFGETGTIHLTEKIDEKINQFQEFWQNNQISWETELQPSEIKSNPELVDILLSNLIGNAGRHNKEGGSIRIKLLPNTLVIENTGSSYPLDKGKLFHRFYKESRHSQHNGLGLSIVKQICDQLDIDIQYGFKNNLHRFTLNWN